MDELSPTHPFWAVWKATYLDVLDIIEKARPKDRVSLCPAALPRDEKIDGFEKSDGIIYLDFKKRQRPLLIIYLDTFDISNGFDKRVEASISKLVNANMPADAKYNIPVRFYGLQITLDTTKDELDHDRPPHSPVTWNEYIPHEHNASSYVDHEHGICHLGHGVALWGSMNVGTIGGFVRLVKKGGDTEEQGLYALTCHHVATNSVQKNASSLNDPSFRRLESPALSDVHSTLQGAAAEIDIFLQYLDKSKVKHDLKPSKETLNDVSFEIQFISTTSVGRYRLHFGYQL